jgi:hypothetical protein
VKTGELLPREYGVSAATILRDAKYAEDLDRIATNCRHDAKHWSLSPEARLPRKKVAWLATQGPNGQRAFIKQEEDRKPVRPRVKEGAARRFLVPAEPRALMAKVVDEIGPELARALPAILAQILAERSETAE